ncbi:hypothetical protein [Paludisphaera soli]|uniref:hypothetical protein n=1 Tax=Paludisphaera soli TaxID=2712865 RepID=UPI0013EDD1B4|nr:hypothetical protein [Paludisphaera soli]
MTNTKLVTGYITRERWVLGKTPREMAWLLGFDERRMAEGAEIFALLMLPSNDHFAFVGHTHWSGGKPAGGPVELWPAQYEEIDRRFMRGPEVRAKDNVRATWTLTGPDRLIKVETKTKHDKNLPSKVQYPPGAGVEQWKLLVGCLAELVRELGPDEKYRP